jgi:hypothetical protein
MQRLVIGVLVATAWWGCASPEQCREDFVAAADAAKQAFEVPDSAAFVEHLADAISALDCSDTEAMLPTEGAAMSEHRQKLTELEGALPCRMYVERLNVAFEALNREKGSEEDAWELARAGWESAQDGHPSGNDWASKCLANDVLHYGELMGKGNAVIGYRMADGLIDQVEAGVEQVRGLFQGGIERLKEAVE